MPHVNRLLTENALQVGTVLVQLLDRVVLTGLLLRVVGKTDFEAWALAAAFAGLVALCEFGFNMYFANRLMIAVENGRRDEAARVLRIANSIFAACALAACGLAVAFVVRGSGRVAGVAPDKVAMLIAMLAVVTISRQAVVGCHALYRAHREYGRFTVIILAYDLARIAMVCGALLAGGGVLVAAAIVATLTVLVQVVFILIDASSRYDFPVLGFAIPTRDEVAKIAPLSLAYFAQTIPLVALSHLPVVAIGEIATTAGTIAIFVLMRTLGGVPRGMLQSMGVVLGQEIARRVAVADLTGGTVAFRETARVLAVLSGAASGFLATNGSNLVLVWTGDAKLFAPLYLLAAITPMLFASAAVLAHNMLSASNQPFLAAIGRLAQLGIALAIAAFAPIADPALRMLVALAVGEILGFAPFAYFAVARTLPEINARFHVGNLLLTLVAAALSYACCMLVLELAPPTNGLERIASFVFGALACAVIVLALGLGPRWRSSLIALVTNEMARHREPTRRTGP